MAIQGTVSAFGPGTVAKWTSSTLLDGELMQKSLDMLLENDNLMTSAIGDRRYREYDNYNQQVGSEKPVISTMWETYSGENGYRYGLMSCKLGGSEEFVPLGYSIPDARKPQGDWYSNGNLTVEWQNTEDPSNKWAKLYWSMTENRWSRIVNIERKPKTSSPAGSSFLITRFSVPCESGTLDCVSSTPGTVQLSGNIELEISRYNDAPLRGEEFQGLYVKYGPRYKKPFMPIHFVDPADGLIKASTTQFLNFNINIPASMLSGKEHDLTLEFSIGMGTGAYIGCKASNLMVTYTLGTV